MQYSAINDPYALLTGPLIDSQTPYRICVHPLSGRNEEVAHTREALPGQHAKAFVCGYQQGGRRHLVLAILPEDRKADLFRLLKALNTSNVSQVSTDEVISQTGWVPGTVPPLSLHPELQWVADLELSGSYQMITLNAGSLGCLVILNTKDYLCVARPVLAYCIHEEEVALGDKDYE